MLPTAPAVVPAVSVTTVDWPPRAVLQPTVSAAPGPLIVPIAVSAVTAIVVPPATELPFISCTLNCTLPVLVAPPETLTGIVSVVAAVPPNPVVPVTVTFAALVDMMIRCSTPIASVEVVQVEPGVVPVQVMPTNEPLPASHLPFWL